MSDHFSDRLQKGITDNANTRFLLAHLLMDSFRDKLTVRDVKTALRNLPQGSDAYDVAYHAAMDRIFAQGQGSSHMAKRISAWILCAHRPLSTLELLHAVAIEPGDTEIDEDNILEAGQLLTICAGLVTIDEQSDSVRFIHYTTQEYLQRNQQTWLPHANTEIARSCTAYLLLEIFQNDTFPVFSERLWSLDMRERYPFYDYAVRHWATHARDAGQESKAMVDMLLQSGKNVPSRAILTEAERGNKQNVNWLFKKTGETPSILLLMNEKHMTFFQLACHNGWTTVVEKLLRGGTPGWKLDVNNMTPLHYSVMKCCEETARLLLDVAKLPIDTSVRRAVWRYDQGNGSPRWEPHLDDNLPDELDQSSGLTALHFAVLIGSVSMTRFLIAHGANVNHPSAYKEGILHVALEQCVQGHRTSLGNYDAWDEPQHRIESTLDFIGCEPEFEDEYQQNVRALEDSRLEILDALLETNALDIHAKDIHDRTSLHCIKYHTSSGSEIETPPVSVRSLQKLIAKGAISSRDDQGRLPLHLACQAGDTAAVRALLQANADLEATDHNGRNALHFAAKGRYLDTIGTILETARQQGCSERLVFTRDIFGQNALHHALRNGWVERDVVVYLADAGIITDQRDMCGKSPLAMYLEKLSMNGANMAAMMEILFSAGADPAYLSKEGLGYHHLYAQTALVLGIEPFRVLQRYGIDITTTDSDGRSLVHYYAMNGHCTVESLDFLTGLGMPLQISDAAGITPLQYANIAVLRVRHVNEWDSDRWGPSRATLYGYIASLLLQQ
jgi:ankyrin repeat protein